MATVGTQPGWLSAYREKNRQVFEAWPWPYRLSSDERKWKEWLTAFAPAGGATRIAEVRGARVLGFDEALPAYGEQIRQALESEQAPHDAMEARANAAFADCFVVVIEGAPAETVSWTVELGEHAAAKVIVLAVAGASAKVLERVKGGNGLLAETVVLGAGAGVSCARIHLAGGWNGVCQQQILARDAKFRGLNLWVEGENVKGSLCLALNGRGSSAEQLDAMLLAGRQKADVRLLTVHSGEHTQAYSSMKNVLNGHSQANFDGMVRILPGGQKTESLLEAHSLLLSREAKSRNVPGLEIEADDVKAKHSASVRHIEEEPLFYLMSRGLPAGEAQEMIIMGFLESLLHRMPPAFHEPLAVELRRKWGETRAGAGHA